MKRVSVALLLTVLSAATVALAQTNPQRPADQPQNQPVRSSGQSTGTGTESGNFDKQALINVCVSQVQVSNPNVPERDIKNFCANQVNRLSPHD